MYEYEKNVNLTLRVF